jgi:hypothetical protein
VRKFGELLLRSSRECRLFSQKKRHVAAAHQCVSFFPLSFSHVSPLLPCVDVFMCVWVCICTATVALVLYSLAKLHTHTRTLRNAKGVV